MSSSDDQAISNEEAINKSCTSYEKQDMSHEQAMDKSGTSQEQVMYKLWAHWDF